MLALISTGWGPGCLSQAGVALINEVYRVETFGLDPHTRAQISQLHTLCHHAPESAVWQDTDIVDAAARALRLAQSDERAAFITPSGPISTALWPIVQQAARTLAIPVRVAHGLGLAESIATCLQLPLPPETMLRPTLADYADTTRMPALAAATQIGDVSRVATLYDGQVRVFRLDLFARQVHLVDLATCSDDQSDQLYVAATQHMHAVDHDNHTRDVTDTLSSSADWVELLNNLTEAVSD